MAIEDVVQELEAAPRNTRFDHLVRVCKLYFGDERIKGSHHVFKTPWLGDPRINLQRVSGKAKPYQVRQVVEALRKLQELHAERKKNI